MEHLSGILNDVAVYLITGVIGFIALEIHKAGKSISKLNTNIAVILEKITFHDKEIERHEERLTFLETKKRGL